MIYKHSERLFEELREKKVSLMELRKTIRESSSNNIRKVALAIGRKTLLSEEIDVISLQSDLNRIFKGQSIINFSKKAQKSSIDVVNTPVINYNLGIKIGTIHSVKGQTHEATLFLSGEWYGEYDIAHALKENEGERREKCRKLIYVASSRPKHLFVFAIEKSAYEKLSNEGVFSDFKRIDI